MEQQQIADRIWGGGKEASRKATEGQRRGLGGQAPWAKEADEGGSGVGGTMGDLGGARGWEAAKSAARVARLRRHFFFRRQLSARPLTEIIRDDKKKTPYLEQYMTLGALPEMGFLFAKKSQKPPLSKTTLISPVHGRYSPSQLLRKINPFLGPCLFFGRLASPAQGVGVGTVDDAGYAYRRTCALE